MQIQSWIQIPNLITRVLIRITSMRMRIRIHFFYFNADLDPTFHFNANPENAPRQSNENSRPLKYDIQALQGSTLGLHASIVGVPDLPQLHLEPHKLLLPDPAHHKKLMRIDADPDPNRGSNKTLDPDPDYLAYNNAFLQKSIKYSVNIKSFFTISNS
jgi:hypothetical protein